MQLLHYFSKSNNISNHHHESLVQGRWKVLGEELRSLYYLMLRKTRVVLVLRQEQALVLRNQTQPATFGEPGITVDFKVVEAKPATKAKRSDT